MKKFVAFLMALFAALTIMPASVFAEPFTPDDVPSPHVLLMDASSGAVLYEKNGYERAFPASTTKIMTCILAIEICQDLNEIVNVGTDFDTNGSRMNFVRNEELRVIDLLYGTMLVSGNDAAYALAVHCAGSEEDFAALMNQKAASLGMTGTHFVKSNGLHKEEHYSTAYDMALLGRYAMQNQTFREIAGAEYFDVPASEWDSDGYHLENANRLIHTMETDEESYKYRYATGIKTGDTDQAGRCLVASAEKDGVELIAVIFGDPQGSANRNLRFANAAKLFDWGFENYASLDVSTLGLEAEFTFPVSGSALTELSARAELSDVHISDTRDRIAAIEANPAGITAQTALTRKLEAPIGEGEVIGTVAYQYESATLFSVDLVAAHAVAAAPVEATPNASASPLLIDTENDPNADEDGGSGLVFWIVLAVVLLLLVFAARVIAVKRRRRRMARRRKAYRSNYTRR